MPFEVFKAKYDLQNQLQEKMTVTSNAMQQLITSKENEIISKINNFHKSDWVEYQNSVKNLNLSPIKEIKELKY